MTTNFEITKIQAFPVNESKNGCVAIVRFELNNAIRFTGVKVFHSQNTNDYSVVYPRNMANKKRQAFFYPCDTELADKFKNTIIQSYIDKMQEQTNLPEE